MEKVEDVERDGQDKPKKDVKIVKSGELEMEKEGIHKEL